MKIETLISLSEDLLKVVDERANLTKTSRSELIEEVLRDFIDGADRDEQNAKDLLIINARADFLNEEAADVLTYQIPL